jgi:hypothetical protein
MNITTDNHYKNQAGPPIASVYAEGIFSNKDMLGINPTIN